MGVMNSQSVSWRASVWRCFQGKRMVFRDVLEYDVYEGIVDYPVRKPR